MKSKGHNRGGKRIIVGATGASGLPILVSGVNRGTAGI